MKNLKLLTDVSLFLKPRKGETKFGEDIQLLQSTIHIYETLINLDVDYVIFGISEDIGVYANHGKAGTHKAWEATLKVLLNIQSNTYINANRVLVLGHLDYSDALAITKKKPSKKHISKARQLVETIDKDVVYLVSQIIKAGKIPIIIGGGHNNAYGNIKGVALAKNEPINVINYDAHTDFRDEEGRHSGNGFSYAYSEGFLNKYFIFGLHENYTSKAIFEALDNNEQIEYNTYENLEVRKSLKFNSELKKALHHISKKPFGIEIDCDAIENIPSSAITPSGFSVKKTRQFINHMGEHKNASYLHICEAAPTKKTTSKVGKLITYFITDFIKAHGHNNS